MIFGLICNYSQNTIVYPLYHTLRFLHIINYKKRYCSYVVTIHTTLSREAFWHENVKIPQDTKSLPFFIR